MYHRRGPSACCNAFAIDRVVETDRDTVWYSLVRHDMYNIYTMVIYVVMVLIYGDGASACNHQAQLRFLAQKPLFSGGGHGLYSKTLQLPLRHHRRGKWARSWLQQGQHLLVDRKLNRPERRHIHQARQHPPRKHQRPLVLPHAHHTLAGAGIGWQVGGPLRHQPRLDYVQRLGE